MQSEHFIINDDTPNDVLFPQEFGRGLELEARPQGFAHAATANPFPDSFLIPQSDWQGLIQERKSRKAGITYECDRVGLKVKDQQQTNYCWANGPTHATEIIRVMQGLAPVALSAASVAAQVTNFRNVGGWGDDALQWIIKNGIDPESVWPNAAISRQYATEANKTLALNYRVTEWWELEPKNLNQLISAVLHDIPVAVGFSWWSHEVCAVDADWIDGAIALVIDNSWGTSWGKNGRGTLQGRKMLPDDAVAPRVVVVA